MARNLKKRKDLKLWFLSYILYFIGAFLALLDTAGEARILPQSFENLSNVGIPFYIATMLVFSLAAWREYRVEFGKKTRELKKAGDPNSGMVAQIVWPMVISQFVVFGIILISFYPLLRVYKKKKTPTHFFLSFTYTFVLLNMFCRVISGFEIDWIMPFVLISAVLVSLSLFITSLIVGIEDRILRQQEVIEEMNTKLIARAQYNKQLAERLAVSAEEMSSNAEEVSSSSENIASSQQQISRGAANQVTAITQTQQKFQILSQNIRNIRVEVDRINDISDSIQGIANQTNMLALNAAIEAARAGEAGRGFNVVAEQVRKLAEESRSSAQQSVQMLENISGMSLEQEKFAVEILQAIDSVATVAEETSASTEESAAAAEEQASSMELITTTAQELLNLAESLIKNAD